MRTDGWECRSKFLSFWLLWSIFQARDTSQPAYNSYPTAARFLSNLPHGEVNAQHYRVTRGGPDISPVFYLKWKYKFFWVSQCRSRVSEWSPVASPHSLSSSGVWDSDLKMKLMTLTSPGLHGNAAPSVHTFSLEDKCLLVLLGYFCDSAPLFLWILFTF